MAYSISRDWLFKWGNCRHAPALDYWASTDPNMFHTKHETETQGQVLPNPPLTFNGLHHSPQRPIPIAHHHPLHCVHCAQSGRWIRQGRQSCASNYVHEKIPRFFNFTPPLISSTVHIHDLNGCCLDLPPDTIDTTRWVTMQSVINFLNFVTFAPS